MAASVVASVALPISNNFSFAPSMDAYGKLSEYGKLGAWSPLSLFANSEVGAWYDPSDLSTMFQDRAGTTPVTADGQTVGKILDKSGNGNHAVAPSDAARPLYKTDGTYHWLQFDGVDDVLQVANIGTNARVSMFVGMSYLGINPVSLTTGLANASSSQFYNATALISSANGAVSNVFCAPSPKFVGVINTDGPADLAVARRNAVDLGIPPIVGGVGMSAMVKLTIGANENGVGNLTQVILYSLIVRGALSTPDEITETETWVNGKTGAY